MASLRGARWIICPSAGGIEPALWDHLSRAAGDGTRVTVGPRVPSRDGSLRALPTPLDHAAFQLVQGAAAHPYFEESLLQELTRDAARDLALARCKALPHTVSATIH